MHVSLERSDPLLHEVISELERLGHRPCLEQYPSCAFEDATFYRVWGKRKLDSDDLNAAEYFRFHCQKPIARYGSYSGSDGRIQVERKALTKQQIGQVVLFEIPVCTDSFREEIQRELFIGPSFREVSPKTSQTLPQPYWQLWSDREMPPLLNRLVHMTDGSEFVPENRIKGCAVDDFYFPPLLRFSAVEVHAMGPFDFALTRERFGSGDLIVDYKTKQPVFPLPVHVPYLIVSKRFREWCMKQKLRIDWYPVVLE